MIGRSRGLRWALPLVALVALVAPLASGITTAAAVPRVSSAVPVPEGLTVTPPAAGVTWLVRPERFFDTRRTVDGARPFQAYEDKLARPYSYDYSGALVPPTADRSAAWVNVTVTSPTAGGHLLVWNDADPQPTASTINFTKGQTVANAVLVRLTGDSPIRVANVSPGRVHVVLDVLGYVTGTATTAPGATRAVPPQRLLDTRSTGVAVRAGSFADVQVAGRGGVPSTGASAAVVNVTVTRASRAGYVVAYPAGTSRPAPASTVNFKAGRDQAALATVTLGGGKLRVFNGSSSGTVDVVVDLVGYVREGADTVLAGVHPVSPTRVLDTRGLIDPLPRGRAYLVDVSAVTPKDASAALITLTATGSSGAGWLAAKQSDGDGGDTSTVNVVAGESVSNFALVPLTEGTFRLLNSPWSTTHAVVDVVGWVTASARVEGRVTDTAGHGIEGVRAGLDGVPTPEAKTAADGTYASPLRWDQSLTRTRACFGAPRPSDPADAGFAGECFENSLTPTYIPFRPGTKLAFGTVLERGSLIRGRVVDSDGNVVTAGLVQARTEARSSGYTAGIRADGTYSIPNLWPGTYRLLVNSARSDTVPQGGYAYEWHEDVPFGDYTTADKETEHAAPLAVAKGVTVLAPDLEVDRVGVVQGTFSSAAGKPEAQVAVRAVHSTGVTITTSTAFDGAFTFRLLPGEWSICSGATCYEDAGGSPTIVVVKGATRDVDLVRP